jgi:hypothetical protein
MGESAIANKPQQKLAKGKVKLDEIGCSSDTGMRGSLTGEEATEVVMRPDVIPITDTPDRNPLRHPLD